MGFASFPPSLGGTSTIGMPEGQGLRFSSDPIVAWRSWLVLEAPRVARKSRRRYVEAMALSSYNSHVFWPPRKPMRAHCLAAWRGLGQSARFTREPHSAPHLAGMCGIYAVKRASGCPKWGGRPEKHPVVYGQVALWGRVLEFQEGYRAEFAYPVELWVLPRDWGSEEHASPETVWDRLGITASDTARHLVRIYGVPAREGIPEGVNYRP